MLAAEATNEHHSKVITPMCSVVADNDTVLVTVYLSRYVLVVDFYEICESTPIVGCERDAISVSSSREVAQLNFRNRLVDELATQLKIVLTVTDHYRSLFSRGRLGLVSVTCIVRPAKTSSGEA